MVADVDEMADAGGAVADLRRAWLACPLFRLGGRLLRFDPVTLCDGVTSIRRGYEAAELLTLLGQAGIQGRVARRPGYRLVATWRPAPRTEQR